MVQKFKGKDEVQLLRMMEGGYLNGQVAPETWFTVESFQHKILKKSQNYNRRITYAHNFHHYNQGAKFTDLATPTHNLSRSRRLTHQCAHLHADF